MIVFQEFQLITFFGIHVYICYFDIIVDKGKEIALFKELNQFNKTD